MSNMKVSSSPNDIQGAQHVAAASTVGSNSPMRSVATATDTPEVQATTTTQAPVLSKPTMSASDMMLALMALQTQANEASVGVGLSTAEAKQSELSKKYEAMAEAGVTYFDTMSKQEDVNGAMSIANIVIAGLMLAGSLALAVLTGGASILATVAAVAGVVAAAASFAKSILSMPAVQDFFGEKATEIMSYICTGIGIAASLVSVCTGIGALRGVANLSTQALRVGKEVAVNLIQIGMAATGVVSSGMGIASSSINYMASEDKAALEQTQAEVDEVQAKLDTNLGDLDIIMKSYASMVESTAAMMDKAYEGARRAATISA